MWTPELKVEFEANISAKNQVSENDEYDDGNFWMSYTDFLKYFAGIHICKVKNWDEVRIKGKFVKI